VISQRSHSSDIILVTCHGPIGYRIYNVYNRVYTTIILKNKIDTTVSTFVLFAIDATCFDPYIGSSSGVQ
jgi:hypothetical protein